MSFTEVDRQAAEIAIRRGNPVGTIGPCSCFQKPPKPRACFGTCKDAVDAVAEAIALARREGAGGA